MQRHCKRLHFRLPAGEYMSITKCLLIAIAVVFAHPAVAAPVTVLGLPIGGKYTPPKRECNMAEIGSPNIQSACWVGKPLKTDYGITGGIEFVGQEKIPLWAAHAMFEISIRKDGILDQLKVSTPGSKDFARVYDSIATKFGQANAMNRGTSARWATPDVSIRLLCYDDICHADFSSTDVGAEARKRTEQKKKQDAERPASV